MKQFIVGNIVAVLLLAASIGQGADKEPLQRPQLSADFAKQRDLIVPNAREQSYRKIDWRNSVLRGVVDAQKNDKPVMIVLMNGHPLGCTCGNGVTTRQLLWTDPKVQELLALMVPTADAIERPGKGLEDGTDFESRFVQKFKKECNNLATYQGVFVVAPSGALLAGSHEDIHDARKVEQLLRRGLEKWGKLSPAERLMTKDVLAKAVAELDAVEGKSRFPRDGLVLSAICRDLPRSPKPSTSPSRNAYNQDFAWFRKDEARAFLPEQPSQGAKRTVPRDLVERLARFHFVDLVRGHTAPFPQKAVERAELTAEVIDVKGNLVSLSYKGRTRTSEVHDGVPIEGKWNAKGPGIPEPQTRGVDARLEGQAVYDRKAERFVSFELVVVSQRWGGNAYNGRLDERDFGPAPMGIVLKLAGGSAAERVPPMFFRSYGWK